MIRPRNQIRKPANKQDSYAIVCMLEYQSSHIDSYLNRTSLLDGYHYSQVLVYKDSKCQIVSSFAISITTTRAIAIFAFGLRIILASKQINSRFDFDKRIHNSCMQLCRAPTIQRDFRYKYLDLFLFYFYQNKIYHGEQEILIHQPIHLMYCSK